jgi:hypothetical protein
VIKGVNWSACEILVILVKFERKLSFLDRLSKNTQMLNVMKIRSVAAELFYADGRTDGHDEANIYFQQLCECA